MKKPIVIIGMGEIGGVFARGFLKAGHPVYPVNQDTDVVALAEDISEPAGVVVAVREKILEKVLSDIPEGWKGALILVQNELLPGDWESHELHPTVISIWFEKKYPSDYKVIIPSPVFGNKADLVCAALAALQIDVKVLGSADNLLGELLIKNLYILTTNISGLAVGGTVGELWQNHRELAEDVAREVLDIQFALAQRELEPEQLIHGMVEAFNGDPDHKCMGRSAHARLDRTLMLADKFGLSAERLRSIKQKTRSDR
jgi:ketopantoate reductase